ncbi:MAG: hypothetical protein RL291_1313 [Pseudomonadota bacterium]
MTKSPSPAPLRLGIAGLGTVGTGLVQLLAEHRERLLDETGRSIEVTAVSARDKKKKRGVDLGAAKWFDDPVALARDPSIDVFVELIGGEEGPAKAAVEAALAAGKPVVTANKALLAKHGVALAALAEKAGVQLNFEAAVAGAIPVIKTLREQLAGNRVRRVSGILNGTCNYILTRMELEGLPFDAVLKDAQAQGYAEADPTFDVGGFDTAHKLTLLMSLAFGTKPAFDQIHVEGITGITSQDIEAAGELGYRIKLLGVGLLTDSGIEARVHPTMVPKSSAIAGVSGVTNAVAIDADYAGSLLLVGPGAGAKATASSVAGDIIDIARGTRVLPFIRRAATLKPHKKAKLGQHQGAYYVRFTAFDRPGVMASITRHMADRNVSLASIVQRGPRRTDGAMTPVIIITHATTEDAMAQALAAIEKDGVVAEKPQMIRIEAV